VGGDLLYLTHQGTLAALDLRTMDLFPIHGNRDTWGGLLAPVWAGNEWHGPARGAVAVSDDQLFWVTGSRVLCLRGGAREKPAARPTPVERAGPQSPPFTPGKGSIDAARLVDEVPRVDGIPTAGTGALRAELAREVEDLLAGWPWAPLYLQMGIGSRDFYFAHPSYAVEALALAYPHLPPELAAKAKARAGRGSRGGGAGPGLPAADPAPASALAAPPWPPACRAAASPIGGLRCLPRDAAARGDPFDGGRRGDGAG
jgi:hypothetical protein